MCKIDFQFVEEKFNGTDSIHTVITTLHDLPCVPYKKGDVVHLTFSDYNIMRIRYRKDERLNEAFIDRMEEIHNERRETYNNKSFVIRKISKFYDMTTDTLTFEAYGYLEDTEL